MKISIFNAVWDIKEVDDKTLEELVNDQEGSGYDGYCDYSNQTIYINKGLHTHRKNVALVHKLLHVMFDYVGLFKESLEEESYVRAMEHHVYELINTFPNKYKK